MRSDTRTAASTAPGDSGGSDRHRYAGRARSRWSWREWYIVALFTGAGGFCLGPSLIGARTLLSVDTLTQYFPWRAAGLDTAGHEICTGDTIDANLPQIAYVRSQLSRGHLGSWQSIVGGGTALSGLPNTGLLDPLSLPYFVLPLWLAPVFVVLLSGVVALGGTYLFLRRLTLSASASLLAGFVFTTSGFMVMWTNWPQTRVAALIPALFWSIERLLQKNRLVDALPVGLVVASMLLGGFPEVTGFALYAAAVYVIVRLVVWHWRGRGGGESDGLRRAAGSVGRVVAGVGLGGLLSAVQMLPFLRFYQGTNLSYRAGESTLGLPLSGLTTLVAPNVNGLCIAGRPMHGVTSPIELVAYVGAAATILAVAGAAFGTGRRAGGLLAGTRGYFAGVAVVAIVLGWVSPTARSLVASLPVFSGNFIGRIRSVLGFALAALAAVGFELVTGARRREPPDRPPLRFGRIPDVRAWSGRVWAALVIAVSLLIGVLSLRDEHRAAFSGGYWRDVRNALWIPAVLAAATIVLLALSRWRAVHARTVAFAVIPVLVVAQGAQFFHTVLPGDQKSNFYPDTPTHRFLAAHLGHDRFAASGLTMYPATALYYGLRTPTGHALLEPAWQHLLQRVDPNVMQSATFSDFSPSINQNNVGHEPILDQMGVRYFVLSPGALAGNFAPLPATTGAVSGAGGRLSCTVAAQALRGISVRMGRTLLAAPGGPGATIDVTVTGGGPPITSALYVGPGVPTGYQVSIALAGESIPPGGNLTVTLSAAHAAGPLVLAGTAGRVACAPVTPKPDGLRLVFADSGSIIYQRLDAEPRIRWASKAVVIPTESARLDALAAGVPGDEVVLDAAGAPAVGRGAQVRVTEDSGDRIGATVTAGGQGYLVVADAMQAPGWSVSVDGHKARLVPADDAMVAVPVPAGTHRISFTFRTPGQLEGASLSIVGVILAVTVLLWDRYYPGRFRRRRRRSEVKS